MAGGDGGPPRASHASVGGSRAVGPATTDEVTTSDADGTYDRGTSESDRATA